MNVTKEGAKHSQLRLSEGSPQKDSAERESYAGACISTRMTENNAANTNAPEARLLEEILERDNMNRAYKRVKSNKGAHGVDGMDVDALLKYLVEK